MKKERRKFSAAFKAKVALEAIKELKTVSELAQEYKIHPTQITSWKRDFLDNSTMIFESKKKREQELKDMEQRQQELYRQIGELKVDNDWLKKKLL